MAGSAASGWSGGGDDAGPLPGVLADERDEADVTEALLVEPLGGDTCHPDEVLQARIGPTGITMRPPTVS